MSANGPSLTGIIAPFAEYNENDKIGIGSRGNLHSSILLASSIKIVKTTAIKGKLTFDVIVIDFMIAALRYLELTCQRLLNGGFWICKE